MFVPYWRDNAEASAILIPGWYRVGYDLSTTITPALEDEIRAMHQLVGNAVTEGRYIVVGAGEMQLTMAAYMAFSMEAQGAPLNVFSAPPYYDVS
jgi:U3 small nucleolar RNA-associated protein 4